MPSRYKCSNYSLYLEKIVSMLEDPERYGEILRWTRDGRAFQVVDRVRLVNEALPSKGGKVCQYVSFKKQMNNYGFASRDDEFFHIHFNRANPKGAKLDYRVCREDDAADRSTATKAALAAAAAKKPLAFPETAAAPDIAPEIAPAPEFAYYHHLNTQCLCLLATGSDCDCGFDFDWVEPIPELPCSV